MASSQEVSHGVAMSEQRLPQKGEGSEPRGSANAVSHPLFLMNGVVEDKPNNYWDWRPSSTFMEIPQQANSAKSKNKNKEKGPPIGVLGTPTFYQRSHSRKHRPATFPRTAVSGREKAELEDLVHHFTFSDVEENLENGYEGINLLQRSKQSSRRGPRPSDVIDLPQQTDSTGRYQQQNEMPNRNQIVSRLMQIREYIRQASSMLSNIDGTGMAGLQNEQILKLGQLQEHLKEQERGYLILLEKMLGEDTVIQVEGRSSQNSGESFATSVAESASINVDARSDISEASTDDVQVNEQIEVLAGLQQQHDLLKKMLQQQEELRNLQNRQTSLMKLQEQIETRLAANETSTEATPSEVSQQTEGSTTVTETSTTPAIYPPSDAESERYKQALEDLRKRTLLRMLNEDRNGRLQELIASTRMEEQREQEQVDLISAEHRELQDKLKTLQQKKMDMDALLQELHSLGGGILDSASSLDPASEAEGSQASRNPNDGGGGDMGNQEMVTNGNESLSKLQEVRHRLTELRGLVQEYDDTTNEVPNNVHDANYEDPELMSNLRRLERGELIGRYRGPHANNHNQASTQTVAPPLINQSEDETQGTPSVTEEETETENESEQSSIPVAWAEDPELREKFRKLETAKQKLRELQELVSIVQETPEAAVGLPDDLAELAMSLTEDVSEVTEDEEEGESEDDDEEEGTQGNKDEEKESGVSEVYSELSEGEVPEQTREAYYEAKMRQQRRELEKLMEERGRLLNVQRQLKELNQKLPPISMINNFSQEHGKFQNRRVQTSSNMQDVLTPSRDEVYAEMRRHKILQEELRQKKRELAVLMAKVKKGKADDDDLNDMEDNDLFRVSMRSADVTAAATWGGSSQMSDGEDNDAYPSDAILAEEEEEEEEGNSIAMTSDTYTVETPQFNPERPTVLPNESDYDESLLEMHGIRFPRRTPRQQYSNLRQENLRPAADLVEDASQYPRNYVRLQMQVDNLEAQLEESIHMTQSLVKDQQSIMNLLYHSMSGSNPPIHGLSPSPAPMGPSLGAGGDPRLSELLHDYDLRLQHQQLMLNLNNAYNDLFKQQEAIENFYKTAEQSASERENVNSNNNAYERVKSEPQEEGQYVRDMYSPYGRPRYVPDSMYEQKYGSQEPSDAFNLAPTFPPGFSQSSQRGNYVSEEMPSYMDQYNSYARQQTARYTHPYETSASYHVPPNSSQRSFESNDQDGRIAQQGEINAPRTASETALRDMKKSATRETRDVAQNTISPADVGIPRLDINSLLRKTERQRMRKMEKDSKKKQQTSGNPQGATSKKGSSSSSQAKSKMAARSKLTDANFSSPSQFRPSLSSHLSGTAFLDTASMASTMSYSSMPGELDQEGLRYLRPVGNDSQRSIKSHSEVESEAGSEYSLFEALRESIYSEVATLISQNESRPHFLIELFRELQMLSTDYLRQRALYALQDLVSKFLTDDSGPQNMEEITGSFLHWPYTTVSEHTPSESFFTSEEEEIKAQLYGQKPGLSASDSKASLSGLQYDYVENVDSASSMSTPPSVGGPGDFGFANDELGNTVIHLDKALQRMREYERMKAEAEASGGTSSKQEEAAPSASDVTSNSSAQDMGSESSFSDLPYPRIDTRQLDLQIKSIMQEVIPYLKEHMDDVCSSQLLAYIRRLVMNLARQRDDSREFVRFFNRQLGSILEDSLSKFSGRKMRECGEDLLVDISEILFNELAFFRLMQDLDTAGDKLKQEMEQEEKKDTTEAEESKGEDEEDEDEEEDDDDEEVEETTGTETGLEDGQYDEGTTDNTTTDEENEALAKTDDTMATVVEVGTQLVQEAMESAMAIASKFEAEELGNDRDDIFAAEIMVSECDEDSEPVDEKGIKIELSVSESNAVTYLGSEEEDDNDQDVVSHKDEETETSLGMSSHTPTDLIENTPQVSEEVTPAEPEETPQEERPPESSPPQTTKSETEEIPPLSTPPTQDTAPSSDSPAENPSDAKDETVCSGELKDANENEVTVDDLPAKLTSLSQMEVEAKMGEESAESDVSKAVLESMVTGENQLAGDGESLPEPEGMPAQNGLPEGEPAST